MEYLTSNVVMLKWMIAEGYGDRRTLERRVARMEAWLEAPDLLEADAKAEYFETIDDMFDMIVDAEKNADRLEVEYSVHGYPSSIDIDWIQDAVDDEMLLTVEELTLGAG